MRDTKSLTQLLNAIPSPPAPLPQVGRGVFRLSPWGEAARSAGEGAE